MHTEPDTVRKEEVFNGFQKDFRSRIIDISTLQFQMKTMKLALTLKTAVIYRNRYFS